MALYVCMCAEELSRNNTIFGLSAILRDIFQGHHLDTEAHILLLTERGRERAMSRFKVSKFKNAVPVAAKREVR